MEVEFVLWLMENEPDCLYKHMEDDDGGREAITWLYEQFKEETK